MSQAFIILSKPHNNPAGPARKVGSETLGHSARFTQLVNSKAEIQTQP